MRTLIIGCGYVGEALGQRLIALGHDVTGIRRSSEHNARLAKLGIRPLNLDITRESDFAKLDGQYDRVVIAASSSRGGEEAYKKVFIDGSENIYRWLTGQHSLRTIVFISSTSVFCHKNGEKLKENLRRDQEVPMTTKAKILTEAEELWWWLEDDMYLPVTVLRASGIYGPNRGHLFRRFMEGKAEIEGDGKRYLNMVHRDDLVAAIIVCLQKRKGCFTHERIYNITDDEPVTQLEFFNWLSETTGRPMPPFGPEPDHSTRKRGITNKRVSNKLFKETFGFKYNYPTFREGLTGELTRLTKRKTR